MDMKAASAVGDIFCTLTGDISVIRGEHFNRMKNGALICNSGHFNVEIDIPGLAAASKSIRRGVRNMVDEYVIRKTGRSVFLLAEGRLINLAAAEGHPASVMDMSFAVQALTSEWCALNKGRLQVRVHSVPAEIDEWVARLKLRSMGIRIEKLTVEQKKYLSSWEMGT